MKLKFCTSEVVAKVTQKLLTNIIKIDIITWYV